MNINPLCTERSMHSIARQWRALSNCQGAEMAFEPFVRYFMNSLKIYNSFFFWYERKIFFLFFWYPYFSIKGNLSALKEVYSTLLV